MRLGLITRRSGRRWWWAFALLIATPALTLSLLGLRVAQLEGLERAQQTRDQQAQFARLADAAIGTMLASIQNELQQAVSPIPSARRYTVFALELSGRLVLPQDKTYFPDPGKPDHHFDPQWPAATAQLFERAQTADQRKAAEASSLFQEIRKKESRLRAWAE